MEVLYQLFAAALAVAAALASLAIWAPRAAKVRLAAVVLTAAFIPVAYLGLMELLSKPKPVSHEWFKRAATKAVVLGIHFEEGTAIHLWLRLLDANAPRAYVLPWNSKLAEKLEDAFEDALANNAVMFIEAPFQRRNLQDWGEVNIEIQRPPLPPQKLPKFPPRIINPREFKI